MQPHSQALAHIEEQLAEQSTQWRDICRALEAYDPCAALPVSDALLAEIDAVCSERAVVAAASGQPMCRGIRA
jgi:hypothetical protein